MYWSPIHESTISLKFLGIIVRVLRLEVSIYNLYITNHEVFNHFLLGGGGGRVSKTFVLVMFEILASVLSSLYSICYKLFLPLPVCSDLQIVHVFIVSAFPKTFLVVLCHSSLYTYLSVVGVAAYSIYYPLDLACVLFRSRYSTRSYVCVGCFVSKLLHSFMFTRGLQRDVVYLGWPIAPSI